MLHQHPGQVAFYGAPAPASTRPTQVPCHHHQGIQPCAVHVNGPHRGAAGGHSGPRYEPPVIFTQGPRQPVNCSAVHTRNTGQPYAVPYGHSVRAAPHVSVLYFMNNLADQGPHTCGP